MAHLAYVAISAFVAVVLTIAAWLFTPFAGVGHKEIEITAAPSTKERSFALPSFETQSSRPSLKEDGRPKFDVVRIDPDGASVFAGTAAADQTVTILVNGREVASARADAEGYWSVVTERPIPAGDVELSLIARGPEPDRTSRGQVVQITVPPRKAIATPAVVAPPQALPPKGNGTDQKLALRQFETFVERARASPPIKVAASPVQAPLPVPITFVTAEAVLTPDGERAAELLAEYLRIVRPASITLTGHADSRGPEGFNMDLSRSRLVAIEKQLRARGYEGGLKLVPLGESVPYASANRNKLTHEQAYQLDRRVELHLNGSP